MRPLRPKEYGKERTYHYRAWVHPKNGGDDREYDIEIIAETRENADRQIESWLKKRSDVTDDYRLMKTTERKIQPVKLSQENENRLRGLKIWALQNTNITLPEINAMTPNEVLAFCKKAISVKV